VRVCDPGPEIFLVRSEWPLRRHSVQKTSAFSTAFPPEISIDWEVPLLSWVQFPSKVALYALPCRGPIAVMTMRTSCGPGQRMADNRRDKGVLRGQKLGLWNFIALRLAARRKTSERMLPTKKRKCERDQSLACLKAIAYPARHPNVSRPCAHSESVSATLQGRTISKTRPRGPVPLTRWYRATSPETNHSAQDLSASCWFGLSVGSTRDRHTAPSSQVHWPMYANPPVAPSRLPSEFN